jgi:hypothetical protein
MELINGKVYKDYRNNIFFDKNNPVLAMKANRDRYTTKKNQEDYLGLPQIGSLSSEDALTWNIFREIKLRQELSVFEKLLGINIDNPKILLWTLSFSQESNELQYTVGDYIRNIDGKHKGQITEPDVIMDCDEYFIVFECKLGQKNVEPGHLWESNGENGPEKRYNDYFAKNYFVRDEESNELYRKSCYQLYRMVFYTIELAKLLNKAPVFVSLTNKTWWNKNLKKYNNTPENLFNKFSGNVKEKIFVRNITWQDLSFNDSKLKECIDNNKCL